MHASKFWQILPYLYAGQTDVVSSHSTLRLFIEWDFHSVLYWPQLKVLLEAQIFFQRLQPFSLWGKEAICPSSLSKAADPPRSQKLILVHLNYKYRRPVNMHLVPDVIKRVLRCFTEPLFIWGSAGSTLACDSHYKIVAVLPWEIFQLLSCSWVSRNHLQEERRESKGSLTFWVIKDLRQGRI